MEKNKALELLEEIESNVSVCCAIYNGTGYGFRFD
jgi:hypothetical protein